MLNCPQTELSELIVTTELLLGSIGGGGTTEVLLGIVLELLGSIGGGAIESLGVVLVLLGSIGGGATELLLGIMLVLLGST